MSDSTTCPSCDASVPAGATFCTSCGAKVGGSPTQAPSAPESPPDDDATRVDHPGLGDTTQVFAPPPGPAPPSAPGPPPAAPWQPAEAPAGPSGAAGPPPAAPWDPPPSPPQPWAQPPPPPGPGGWPQPPAPTSASSAQWGAPAHAPADTSRTGATQPSPLGGLAAAVGAVLVLAGLFLPWIGNNQDDAGYEASGWDLTSGDRALESVDPYIVLALGIVGLVIAGLLLAGLARPLVRLAAVVAGLAVVAVLVRDWMTITDLVADQRGSSFEVSAQIGFYLAIAGGVVLALASLVPAATRSSSGR